MEGHSAVIVSPLGCVPNDSKESIRQRVWDYLEKENIAESPRPVYGRIPNFKGAFEASDRLANTPFFRKANIVKVNPDSPQQQARFRVLENNKTLLVPTPRLQSGLFNKIIPPRGGGKESLHTCATSKGVRDFSVPIELKTRLHVDLVVLGSVATSPKGFRIGKGEGYADMEYAMMVANGAADERTLVVTTVHDSQVMDLPEHLFAPNDVPVDYIVTPSRIIQCLPRSRPSGILWNLLSQEKYTSIPILRTMRGIDHEAGKDVRLADGSPIEERTEEPVSLQSTRKDPALIIGNIPRGTRTATVKAEIRELGVTMMKGFTLGRNSFICLFRTEQDLEDAMDRMVDMEINGYPLRVERAGERKERKVPVVDEQKEKPHLPEKTTLPNVLFVGNLPRFTKYSSLKHSLEEANVFPSDIVLPRGKSFAFLTFGEAVEAEESMEKLDRFVYRFRMTRVAWAHEKRPVEEKRTSFNESKIPKPLEKNVDEGGMSHADDTSPEKSPSKQRRRRTSKAKKKAEKPSEEDGEKVLKKSPSRRRPLPRDAPQGNKTEGEEEDEEEPLQKPIMVQLPAIRITDIPEGMRVRPLKDLIRKLMNVEYFYRFRWMYFRKSAVAVLPPGVSIGDDVCLEGVTIEGAELNLAIEDWNVRPYSLKMYERRQQQFLERRKAKARAAERKDSVKSNEDDASPKNEIVTPVEDRKSVTPKKEATPSKEAAKAVSPSKEDAVTPSKEASKAVSPSKEAAKAVSPSKEDAVAPRKEVAKAVSPSKEAAKAVSPSKEDAVTPSKEAAKAVSPSREAAKAVSPSKEAAKAVSPSREAAKAVSPSKEAAKAVSPSREAAKAVSPSKEAAVAPSKEAAKAVSPSKEAAVAPSKEAAKAVSPSKEDVTPKEEAASPSRDTVSPSKDDIAPGKETATPVKQTAAPSKEVVTPSKDTVALSKEAVSPKKDIVTPSKEAVTPKKDIMTPSKEAVTPEKDIITPSKEAVTPEKDIITPSKEAVTPEKDIVTPSKEAVTPKKDIITPSKEAVTPKKDIVTPSNEAVGAVGLGEETTTPIKVSASEKSETETPEKAKDVPKIEVTTASPAEVLPSPDRASSPEADSAVTTPERKFPSDEVSPQKNEQASSPSQEAEIVPSDVSSPSKILNEPEEVAATSNGVHDNGTSV